MFAFCDVLMRQKNLVPRVFVPLDQRSENESSGSNHFEITKGITESAHPVSLRSLHLWRMTEMVAPRALVFRPLVKGNEDSGNEIGDKTKNANKLSRVRSTNWKSSLRIKCLCLAPHYSNKSNIFLIITRLFTASLRKYRANRARSTRGWWWGLRAKRARRIERL